MEFLVLGVVGFGLSLLFIKLRQVNKQRIAQYKTKEG